MAEIIHYFKKAGGVIVGGITEHGAVATLCVAGEALAIGEVVYVNQAGSEKKVYKNPVDSDMPVGVACSVASADGDSVYIITTGLALVLPEAGVTAAKGNVIYSSGSTAGRVAQSATIPAATAHFREIGHFLAAGTGNGVATLAFIHFN